MALIYDNLSYSTFSLWTSSELRLRAEELLLPKIKMNRKLITKYYDAMRGFAGTAFYGCARRGFLCKNNDSIENKLSNAQWFRQIYIRFIHDDISTINFVSFFSCFVFFCGREIFYDFFRYVRLMRRAPEGMGKVDMLSKACMRQNLHMIGFPCDISEYWFGLFFLWETKNCHPRT